MKSKIKELKDEKVIMEIDENTKITFKIPKKKLKIPEGLNNVKKFDEKI